MNRRLPALLVSAAAIIGVAAAAWFAPAAAIIDFGATDNAWMPHAVSESELTEAWFCAGIPATGDDTGGQIRIANRLADPAVGTVLLYNDKSETKRIEVEVPAFGIEEIDVASNLPGEITSAVVEIEGGGTLVEQISLLPDGNSIAPCSNDTSTTWYFADGSTADGSRNRILLSNPYDQAVVAKLDFSLASRSGPSDQYQNIPILPRTVKIIDLGTPGSGAQNEPMLAVKVEAVRGKLVVGRVQEFAGGGRAGTQVSLASPTVADQWRFAGGQKGDGIVERYRIYNPTDDIVEVETVILGTVGGVDAEGNGAQVEIPPIEVASRGVVEWLPGDAEGLPEGRYSIVFATLDAPSIVVERVTTQSVGDSTNTTVILGAIARPSDLYLATQWNVPVAPTEALEEALVVHNLDAQPGTLTVYAIGADGPVEVPSLTEVELPSFESILRIDLTAEEVLGKQLIIQTTNRVIVERWTRSGRGDTRTVTWAFPTA